MQIHPQKSWEQGNSEQDLFSVFGHQAKYNTSMYKYMENRNEKHTHKQLREIDIHILQGTRLINVITQWSLLVSLFGGWFDHRPREVEGPNKHFLPSSQIHDYLHTQYHSGRAMFPEGDFPTEWISGKTDWQNIQRGEIRAQNPICESETSLYEPAI